MKLAFAVGLALMVSCALVSAQNSIHRPKATASPTQKTFNGRHTVTTMTRFPDVKKELIWAGRKRQDLVMLTTNGRVFFSSDEGGVWIDMAKKASGINEFKYIDRIQAVANTSKLLMFQTSRRNGIYTFLFDFDSGAFSIVTASFGRNQQISSFPWLTKTSDSDAQVAKKGLFFDRVVANPMHPNLAFGLTVDPSCPTYPNPVACRIQIFVTGLHGLQSYSVWRPITMFNDFWMSAEWGSGLHQNYHVLFAIRRATNSSLRDGRLVSINIKDDKRVFTMPNPSYRKYTIMDSVVNVARQGKWMFALTFDAFSQVGFALRVSTSDFWTTTRAKFPMVHKDGTKIKGHHYSFDIVDIQEEIFVTTYANHLQQNLWSRRWGNTYVSGAGGRRYTLSLDYTRRHINPSDDHQKSATDFHRVGALEGVIVANQLQNPDNIRCLDCTSKEQCDKECVFGTVMSRDNGKTWQRLPAPAGLCAANQEGTTTDDAESDGACSLHLHGKTSADGNMQADIKALMSSKTAPGLIIGSGNVGSQLEKSTRSLFMSRNGGESWSTLSTGRHLYGELNYGSVIFLVKHAEKSGWLNYTVDSGAHWRLTKFMDGQSKDTFIWSDMLEIPHYPGRSYFTLFGVEEETGNAVSARVQFNDDLLGEDCKPTCTVARDQCPSSVQDFVGTSQSDFEYFIPSSYFDESGAAKRCLMGRQLSYARLKAGKKCRQHANTIFAGNQGKNVVDVFKGLAAPSKMESCECTYDDYECDWFYYEKGGTPAEDVPEGTQADSPGDSPGNGQQLTCVSYFKHPDRINKLRCSLGSTWYLQRTGYRKIAGDGCVGGIDDQMTPENRTCPNAPKPGPITGSSSWSGLAKFILFLLVVGVLGLVLYFAYHRVEAVKDVVDKIIGAASSVMPSNEVRQYSHLATGDDDDDDDGRNSGDEEEQMNTARRPAAGATSSSSAAAQSTSITVAADTDSSSAPPSTTSTAVPIGSPLGSPAAIGATPARPTTATTPGSGTADLIDIFD